ncbi:MAG: endonuclease [Bacteroidetes bacterium HGW-Bacteroidetes-2]|jgi:putative endonuclease|nr:MAG: endonuclease [Bacteroidetes bacterium HGW-Bacteroidetes-2]
MADHNELGKIGEKLAAELLRSKGYKIVARNYFYDKAEIDIIAKKDALMVCVEVKTRNSDFFGDPQSFVTPGKIKQMVKAMNFYLIENDIQLETRFDIIAVLKNNTTEQVMHYEDAFYFF